MSLNITNVSISPNIVYASSQFIISIEVYDDAFEFSGVTLVYDKHQGFADIDQTIGGMLQEFVPADITFATQEDETLILNGAYIAVKKGVNVLPRGSTLEVK